MSSGSQTLPVQSSAYRNFLIHIRNPLTKAPYVSRLKRYLQYCQTDSYDDLLYGGDIKQIQARIEDFLIHIQNPDYHIRPATVGYYLVSIRFFYTMNDIVLNWKKIAKVLPAPRKGTEDRPYTRDEIAKLLEKADQRGRVVILLMCSSGMREGAIAPIKLAHTERMGDIYKITVYKNDPEEYTTFCSPECAKAIDDYLSYRQRYGESLHPSAPLIRQVFNKINPIDSAQPKPLGVGSVENIIYRAIYDSGLREKKNVIAGEPRYRHEVMQSHGLRKFFNTQIVTSGMSVLYAEMLMGHRGLTMEYVKPTVLQLYEEYMKIVDSVTIDESQKLKREVKTLREENTEIQKALVKIDRVYDKLGL